jgi:WD40 repeat protein
MVYEKLRKLARARTVEVYDLASRKRTAELRGHSALVSRVELNSRDAAIAVSAGNDGALRLWHIPSRRPLAAMEFFDGWDVTTASWAPDGRRMVVGGADGTVVIIDPAAVERFIAANAEYNVARLRARGQEFTGTAEALRWAERVLSGSGDIAPEAGRTPSDTPSGTDPESIRAWGASRRGSGTPW